MVDWWEKFGARCATSYSLDFVFGRFVSMECESSVGSGFGTGSGVENRQNWESLVLKFDGLLTLPVFREFWEKFLML